MTQAVAALARVRDGAANQRPGQRDHGRYSRRSWRASQCCRGQCRRGLSLTELLVAATIMVMIVGAMSMLAMTVHSANDHCQGQSTAAQHGRVVLDHITRSISSATASESFPGVVVISDPVGSWTFPDTLVVWLPEGPAADPEGLPRVSEIVLFAPDLAQPNSLVRLRQEGNNATVPAATELASWRALAAAIRTDPDAERTVLTNRLRTGSLIEGTGAGTTTNVRGCLRFTRLMAPSESEWADYKEGDLDWDEVAWPLDAFSSVTGTRRVVCQIELQIAPADTDTSAVTAVPFFGSAGVTYDLSR